LISSVEINHLKKDYMKNNNDCSYWNDLDFQRGGQLVHLDLMVDGLKVKSGLTAEVLKKPHPNASNDKVTFSNPTSVGRWINL
jgi:hypothetical protein